MRVACVALRDQTRPEIEGAVESITWIYPGEVGAGLAAFRAAGVREVVMAGKVTKSDLFQNPDALRLDASAVGLIGELADRKDDTILGKLADFLETLGLRLLPQYALTPELLAPEGVLTRTQPTEAQRADIAFGFPIAKAIGDLDIGQTVVVKDRAVLAVEAIEGTDAAIRRAGAIAAGRVRGEGGEAEPGPALRRADDRARHGRGARRGEDRRARDRGGRHAWCSSAKRSCARPTRTGSRSWRVRRGRRRVSALRIAVIGAGVMGGHHARKVRDRAQREGDVALVGICDADVERARAVGRELGVPAVADARGAVRGRRRGDRRGLGGRALRGGAARARGGPRRAGREADRGDARRGRGARRARARAARACSRSATRSGSTRRCAWCASRSTGRASPRSTGSGRSRSAAPTSTSCAT